MWLRRSLLALVAIPSASAAQTPPAYVVAVVPSERTGVQSEPPIVTDVVNRRTGTATLTLGLAIRPSVAGDVRVRWSSPDGSSEFSDATAGPPIQPARHLSYDASVSEDVAVYRRGNAVGSAIIVADIGPPVNQRETLAVEERAGIGFGCYIFMKDGESVRIVGGEPQKASLATADVAMMGPPVQMFDGCHGENVDPNAKTFRLVFGRGGRVGETGPFVKEMPAEALERAQIFDIEAADGRTYRIHISANAVRYLEGWIEPLPLDAPQ